MPGRVTELAEASQEMPQFLRTASNQRRRICGSVASDLPIVSNDATDGTIAGVRGIFGIMFPVVSPNTPTDIASTEPFPRIVECDGSDYPNSDSDRNGGGPPAHMLRGYSQSDLDTQSGSEAVVRDEPVVVLPTCLLYTSDADDDPLCVALDGRRIIKTNTAPIHSARSHV